MPKVKNPKTGKMITITEREKKFLETGSTVAGILGARQQYKEVFGEEQYENSNKDRH